MAGSEDLRFEVWAQDLFELLYAEGYTRRKDESPMAFGRRVDHDGHFSVALGPVGECLSLIHYSRVHAQNTDTMLIRDTSVLLKSELTRPARLKYIVRRLFLPLSKRHYAK